MNVRSRKQAWTLLLTFTSIGLVLGGLGVWGLYRNVAQLDNSELDALKTRRPTLACQVFDHDERLIDEFYLERRVWVSLKSLPPIVWQAFIAAEDSRFFEHQGVDLVGILRAALSNVRASSVRQGGSGITQQLVKNLVVGNERTLRRKLREALLAYRLERLLSKEQILELYINYVYLGSGNFGVEAAARDYFGKGANELSAGEAALIAGLVPAPSRYSPRRNRDRALERRNLVISRMIREGFLARADAEALVAEPIPAAPPRARAQREGAAFLTQVRRDIRNRFGAETPFQRGLRIYTDYDPALQRASEAGLRQELERHRTQVGALLEPARLTDVAPPVQEDVGGPCHRRIVRVHDGHLRIADDEALPTAVGLGVAPDLFLLSATNKSVPLRSVPSGTYATQVCLHEAGWVIDPRPWAQGSIVVMDIATGAVRALVGGYEDRLEGLVRATQTKRQPGSSFKPYVYAAALSAGYSQLSPIVDGPLPLRGSNGKAWSPKNHDDRYMGPINLRTALTLSRNPPSVRLALALGPERILTTARSLGIRSAMRADLTLALGSSEVNLLEHVNGIASIARYGVRLEPSLWRRVEDVDGAGVVPGGAEAPAPSDASGAGRVLNPGVAAELINMLTSVVQNGTARRAFNPDFDQAGKTGTTNDFRDVWFVGFTPSTIAGVWIGSDSTASLGKHSTGATLALPVWQKVMAAVGRPANPRFELPDSVMLTPVGREWLVLRRSITEKGRTFPGEG